MAIDMTFVDYVTPVPADWLNNVNQVVNHYTNPIANAVARSLDGKLNDTVSVFDLGAVADGVSDNSVAFTNIPAGYTAQVPFGVYNFTNNTTITGDLLFMGGVLNAPSGVTVTINGGIIAPSKIILTGAGTFVINKGIIDVAWFDGTDANTKTAFAFRGIQNTNGTGKVLAYYPPSPSDSWATQSANLQWGYGWRVTAPIDIEQVQTYTVFMTYSSFIATAAMDSIWLIGNGATKADGVIFPVRLKTDGGNGLATWGVRIRGTSHTFISHCELYYSGGIALSPNGTKQCSGISIGYMDTGALYGPALLTDGASGVGTTVTDVEVGFINSTGFVTGHAAAAVVQIGSNSNGITIRKVTHRAVVAGTVDATTAVVLITNSGASGPNAVSCRYGINIGPVLNGSLTLTAEAVVVADASSGTAAKMTGITLDAGSQVDGTPPGGATISLNYTSGAIIQGMPGASTTNSAQIVNVNSTCINTFIYGVTPSQVTNAGVNTLINGVCYSPITAVTFTGFPFTYANGNPFAVRFNLFGATTLTGAVYTRGAGTQSVPVQSGQTAVLIDVYPNDSVTVNGTGSATVNILPR